MRAGHRDTANLLKMPPSSSSLQVEDNGPKDLDYILDHLVGGGGRWQWTKMVFLIPVYVAMGLPLLLHMFTAYTPEFRCLVPACDGVSNGNSSLSSGPAESFGTEAFLEFALPKDNDEGNFLK